MRVELHRKSIQIVSESPQDVAFIEDTLRLKDDGDSINLTRKNRMKSLIYSDGNTLDYLEVKVNEGIPK